MRRDEWQQRETRREARIAQHAVVQARKAERADNRARLLQVAREWSTQSRRNSLLKKRHQEALESQDEPSAIDPACAPEGLKLAGWTTRSDGALECSGGPLVCRVSHDPQRPGYVWSLHCHSWVEPVLVELASGRALSLAEAKLSAALTGRKELTAWLRKLCSTRKAVFE